jgi:hypothetical protein
MTRTRGLAAFLSVVLLLVGCGGDDDTGGNAIAPESTQPTTITTSEAASDDDDEDRTTTTEPAEEPPTSGTNAGVVGDLQLGRSTDVGRTTISPAGGSVTIERGTLEGFEIEVPPGAFETSTTFDISLTEITGDSFGKALMAISPLITIDNGGVYSASILTVRLPVKVPTGMFAMGFLYDGGDVEAMPLIDAGGDGVIVATRHFSSFFVGAIERALLPEEVGTGYRVQEDNWQFVNRGTYAKPNGICTGMSLTSIWYFLERKSSEGHLWERWDDDGRRDTPGFWYDDAWALRWATKAQTEMSWLATQRQTAWQYRAKERLQYDAFRYAMYLTGEPQLLEMWDANGGNGHAMVVYAHTTNSLWVADPNYPKDLRQIHFDDDTGEFKTYSSGTNAETVRRLHPHREVRHLRLAQHRSALPVDAGWRGGGGRVPAVPAAGSHPAGRWLDLHRASRQRLPHLASRNQLRREPDRRHERVPLQRHVDHGMEAVQRQRDAGLRVRAARSRRQRDRRGSDGRPQHGRAQQVARLPPHHGLPRGGRDDHPSADDLTPRHHATGDGAAADLGLHRTHGPSVARVPAPQRGNQRSAMTNDVTPRGGEAAA